MPAKKIAKKGKTALYEGARTIDGIKVTFGGERIDGCETIHQFCDGGFEWGYYGDAPKQLALALIMHRTGDADTALALADAFAEKVVSELDNYWILKPGDIDAFVKTQNG